MRPPPDPVIATEQPRRVIPCPSCVLSQACVVLLAATLSACCITFVIGASDAGIPVFGLPASTAMAYLVREAIHLALICTCLVLTVAVSWRGGPPGNAAWTRRTAILVLSTCLLQLIAAMNAGDAACEDVPPCGVD